MADWRKMAKTILLADGTIDEREVAAIRKELFADGKIDDIELEFLFELRSQAKGVKASFNVLLVEAIKSCALENGVLKPGALSFLRHLILGDGKADAGEKVFLQQLRAAMKQVPADFDAFYKQCMAT
jgi:pyrroline-5-carboxylate reductase